MYFVSRMFGHLPNTIVSTSVKAISGYLQPKHASSHVHTALCEEFGGTR